MPEPLPDADLRQDHDRRSDEELVLTGFRVHLIASELATISGGDDPLERFEDIDRLVHDLVESYAGLRVAASSLVCPPKRTLN